MSFYRLILLGKMFIGVNLVMFEFLILELVNALFNLV